ncbi:MAG: carboxypeptidase M32 [Gaiellales bacterium]
MPDSLDRLKARLGDVHDLRIAARLLEWDQLVMMPPSGAPRRADQISTIHRLAHELFTADEVGELLEELRPLEGSLEPESVDASLIRVARSDWEKARRIPASLQASLSHLASEAVEAWTQAREASDYAAFRPWLDRTLELKHQYIECFDVAEPYDALLDDYEPGMRTSEVRDVFARLKPELLELTRSALEDEPGDEAFVTGFYSREGEEHVSHLVTRAFGFDIASYRLDPTVHPFCTSFAVDDIRLTTRYNDHDLLAGSLFSTMHEAGHGLYEHGIAAELDGTLLAEGCSSILHESQSRLWENVIGRSAPFWRWFYPTMQATFAETLRDVSLAQFLRSINRLRPSLIRVNADETTYGLHVILRFELEQDLLSGKLSTTELPEAWNSLVHDYLGIDVPDDAHGCLQDVHWASGGFGYFPTYQLGNVVASQIWNRLAGELPDAEAQVEHGQFTAIRTWLIENLYRLGRTLTPAETIVRAAGGPIDPEPYLAYLRAKLD